MSENVPRGGTTQGMAPHEPPGPISFEMRSCLIRHSEAAPPRAPCCTPPGTSWAWRTPTRTRAEYQEMKEALVILSRTEPGQPEFAQPFEKTTA